MRLHYNQDGSIQMTLHFKGILIEKTFLGKKEYYQYLQNFSI